VPAYASTFFAAVAAIVLILVVVFFAFVLAIGGIVIVTGRGLSPATVAILAIVGVILFGKRLPEIGRSLGRTLTDFKYRNRRD
jgi:hypothetical protein